jgi:hypothetical protein
MNYQFIKMITTYQTGGGCMVDFVMLKGGKVLAIDNDTIGLYDSLDEFYEGKDGHFDHIPLIEW